MVYLPPAFCLLEGGINTASPLVFLLSLLLYTMTDAASPEKMTAEESFLSQPV